MTAALKLRSTQQLCQCFGLRSWRNARLSPPQRLKAYYDFRHPICVKRGFLQWQQPKQNNGITWRRKTLRVSLSPIIPRWSRLVAEKQALGSH